MRNRIDSINPLQLGSVLALLLLLSSSTVYAQEATVPQPAPVQPTPGAGKATDEITNQFIAAIHDGDLARVTKLLAQGANVNATDNNQSTPLMQAAAAAPVEVVRLLLDKGADIHARDKSGFSPLLVAAYAGHLETVQLLLEKGADPQDADKDQHTALMGAAYSGKDAVVKLLLDRGASVSTTDKDGFTPLMVAAGTGNVALMQLLIDKGANINAPTKTGFTPLMQASGAGKAPVVSLLLKYGAEVNARAGRGASALLVASYAGNTDIVQQLIAHDAEVNATDSVGHTPLIGAAYSGNVTVARLLLDHGADIKAQTTAGLDALMQAAYSGREVVAKFLLERGAAVDSRTARGLTPLMQAVGSGNQTVARLLLDHGADINAVDASNQTPAVWAKKRGHEELLPFLQKAGARIGTEAPVVVRAVPAASSPFATLGIAPPDYATKPEIHGPHIVGASPKRPFLYRIPGTGSGPLTYTIAGLPSGLSLDHKTGMITGSITAPGTHSLTVTVAGTAGKSAPFSLKLVCGERKLALTPPMGWSAWNLYGDSVDAEKVRMQADYLIKTGLAAHGFNYILLDDSWQGRRDSQTGEITSNRRLGDIKALADYLHARGLKLGIYSSPNEETSGGYAGSKDHVLQDARTFASWNVDYLKYDWSDNTRGKFSVSADMVRDAFAEMRTALDKTDRDIVFAVTPYGFGGPQPFGDPPVLANSWWTSTQVIETWEGVARNGFQLVTGFAQPAGPGHWNDPGWLLTGKVGSATLNPHFTKLTAEEQKTQLALWSLAATPLILSCDVTQLDPNAFYPVTTALLTNDEIIAVDQDSLGVPATQIGGSYRAVIWARPLSDGTYAVGMFNRGDSPQQVTVNFSDLPAPEGTSVSGPQPIRDLWRRADRGTMTDKFTATVPRHGVVLIKIGKPKATGG
jgi:alpha-galactosidase